jgi:hypothetical protein
MKLVRSLALPFLFGVCLAQEIPEQLLQTEVPPRAGEICLGCNHPIGADDKCYLVEGQRVPVHRAGCDDSLRASPLRYLASLKPRGGFFGGERAPGAVSNAWLLLGLYVLAGLCFAALCAHRALNQGLSPYLWFLAGFLFSAPAYLVLLTRPAQRPEYPAGLVKIPATAAPQACPQCGAMNHPAAERCLECGSALRPAILSEVSRLRSKRN